LNKGFLVKNARNFSHHRVFCVGAKDLKGSFRFLGFSQWALSLMIAFEKVIATGINNTTVS
jgi:hypothetical protein